MRSSWFILVLGFSTLAAGTELTDLGQGLAYLRIHSITDASKALRSAVPAGGALVLDLRYATAEGDSVDALRAALASRSTGALLFVLVSPATPPAAALAVGASPAPWVTLGAPGSQPGPKVVVNVDTTADRRAYDAMEAGTPVGALVTGRIEKERFDEAKLVHEFKNGNPDAAPPPAPDPTTPPAPGAGGQAGPAVVSKPEPPVDRVLQRAVHLHRALVALRR